MKELVVISGKGGTGKTSIVGAMASLFNNQILADCDTDASDLHLLLQPQIKEKEFFIGGKVAQINQYECIKCGLCKQLCRFDAIDSEYQISEIECEGCGVCALSCPKSAISLKDSINAEWYISESRHGKMVHALMTIGSENSGKLVTLLRTQASILAKKNNIELILIDGSPGIGCPVIASVTSTYCCLVVTEPTLSGFHDMKRIIKLLNKFKTSFVVCINKYDINNTISSQIEAYCTQHNIKVIGKIPYDITVTRAQINGKNIMEYHDSPAAVAINKMWIKLKPIIEEE